ncbi:hypothetical protein M3O40_15275 [Xanthomonas nasturtii]|uniref:hypothetical protein n=1 Tax=Xanthomonas nasturtii TaxID=1843581 RepID=UPI00201111D8|nr:hypothetical protein [Xanthomonas nasturtii]MCL1500692.1 hypothetical protein [Xanthomonas nasturtii]MCL1504449.1 hypothetical protein [Xanthomonas nasturtii]
MTATELREVFLQTSKGFFRKTPVLLLGSGFSCGYELPGTGALTQQLATAGDATLLPTHIKMAKPKYEPRSETIAFGARWATPQAEVDLVVAVESMRRQSRAQEN